MTDDIRNVFVSHIHEDDEGLRKLKDLLRKSKGIKMRDYSINSEKPNDANDENYIKQKILKPRIERSGVVVVYISQYTKAKESKYVDYEIKLAHRLGKRIVGVWAHGDQGCEIPEMLDKYADAVVGWTGNSIVDAINGEKDGHWSPDGEPYAPRKIERWSCSEGITIDG